MVSHHQLSYPHTFSCTIPDIHLYSLAVLRAPLCSISFTHSYRFLSLPSLLSISCNADSIIGPNTLCSWSKSVSLTTSQNHQYSAYLRFSREDTLESGAKGKASNSVAARTRNSSEGALTMLMSRKLSRRSHMKGEIAGSTCHRGRKG
jgi:hypothetical protein